MKRELTCTSSYGGNFLEIGTRDIFFVPVFILAQLSVVITLYIVVLFHFIHCLSLCQFVPKVAWYKAKPEDCCAYAELLRHKLTGIDIPVASVLCHDVFAAIHCTVNS